MGACNAGVLCACGTGQCGRGRRRGVVVAGTQALGVWPGDNEARDCFFFFWPVPRRGTWGVRRLARRKNMQTGVDSWEARSDLVRRKENLLKQPSALALWPGSVQSPNVSMLLPMLRASMPRLSSFSTGPSATQPARRHVEILPCQGPTDARLKRPALIAGSGSRFRR